MSNLCSQGQTGERINDQRLGATGTKIRLRLPRRLLLPKPEDVTLYFFESGFDPISKAEAKVRVGFKETGTPQMVCYCFEHTKDEIQDDYQAQGESRIEDRIREKVTAGSCSCEVMNPKGNCCLGDVRAAYKELSVPLAI